MHGLVKTFNHKLKECEVKHENTIQEINNEVQSINVNVTSMLEEIPQVTSIENRFSSIEETISSFGETKESRTRLGLNVPRSDSMSSISCDSHDKYMLAITNEVDQRQKRRRSLVIHNVKESNDVNQDLAKVKDILQYVVKEECMVDQNLTNLYRLGKQSSGKNRTIKLHFRCEEFSQTILQNARNLSTSKSYTNIVIQPDLTPLQRSQVKLLVQEKNDRNQYAVLCNEQPDWVIRKGKLCRKSEL